MRFTISQCARVTIWKRWNTLLIRSLIFAIVLVGGSSPAYSQTVHSVTLTWTASTSATASNGLFYTVYRLLGACPATPPASASGSGFVKVSYSAISGTTYVDSGGGGGVSLGTYCYFVTATLSGVESLPSVAVQVNVVATPNPPPVTGQPAAPTQVAATQSN